MDQLELTKCDLCENRTFRQIGVRDRDGRPFSTAICEKCGLVRHAFIPSEEELVQFYSTDYREVYNRERMPGARRIMRAWKNGLRICQQVAPLLRPKTRILEVGAGIGCTVKVFEQAGFAAEGIDPGGEFLSFSRDKLHARVQVRNLYDLSSEDKFDNVLLVHVVEHFRSPAKAMNRIASLMTPGGMLYVECPNLQAPFAYRGRLFHAAHIHNFVPSTLKMLAETSGFRLHRHFGDDRDPNLQMLFRNSGDRRLDIDTENFDRTLRQLKGSDRLRYHLRWRYVTDRAAKLAAYAQEYLRAKTFVCDVVRSCPPRATEASAGPQVRRSVSRIASAA